MYLCNGVYEDPSGNWHELGRAIILLIGIAAFELCTNLPVKLLAFLSFMFLRKREGRKGKRNDRSCFFGIAAIMVGIIMFITVFFQVL